MGRQNELLLFSVCLCCGWHFWRTSVVPINLNLCWGKSSSFTNASRKQNWQKPLLSQWHPVELLMRENLRYTLLLRATPLEWVACSPPPIPAELNSTVHGCKQGSKTAFTIYTRTGNSNGSFCQPVIQPCPAPTKPSVQPELAASGRSISWHWIHWAHSVLNNSDALANSPLEIREQEGKQTEGRSVSVPPFSLFHRMLLELGHLRQQPTSSPRPVQQGALCH